VYRENPSAPRRRSTRKLDGDGTLMRMWLRIVLGFVSASILGYLAVFAWVIDAVNDFYFPESRSSLPSASSVLLLAPFVYLTGVAATGRWLLVKRRKGTPSSDAV
jgi:hypothetical protein